MRMPIAGFWVTLAVVAFGLGAKAETQTIEGEFKQSFAIVGEDALTLDVRTKSGGIEVRAGEPGEARVTARVHGYADRWTPDGSAVIERRVRSIEARQARPPMEFGGDVLRVGFGQESPRQVGITYGVVVPVNTRVRVHTGSGTVVVRGARGPVEATNGAGATLVTNVAGDVTVAARTGRVELREVAGDIDARTGSGRITIVRPGMSVRAYSGSGRVHLKGVPNDIWDLSAASGEIRLELPNDGAFEIDAHTRAGEVSMKHRVDVSDSGRGRLYGTVGVGGPRLVLRTGSGHIVVD